MRRVMIGFATVLAWTCATSTLAAPPAEKSLLGIRIMDTWKSVLAKFGRPTRIEAGPPAEVSISPTVTTGGTTFSPPGMGTAAGPGMPPMVGMGGPPAYAMMGPMSSAGGSARGPMVGGMGMSRPPAGAMGAMSSPGGPMGSSMGMGTPMSGPPRGAMGGMTSPGGPMGSSMGMSAPMSGPPRGAMGGMTSPGGRGLPGLGGMGMAAGLMGASGPGALVTGTPGGMTLPGMPPGGMLGAPMLGAMPGSPGSSGMTGGFTQTTPSASIETGPGEVAWVYEKGTTTHVFLFNNEGRVIQIQSFGYAAGARTSAGVGLGDTAAKIYSIYGFPEETIVSGNTRTLVYSSKANAAFQLAEVEGKGLRVVGITVALTKAPNPEKPD